MKMFFDESGVFKVPSTADDHAVGIVSGVVIPETIESAVFEAFESFLQTLPATAFDQGEVKGRLLDEDARSSLADMIVKLPAGILFCPIVLDLTSLVGTPQANASAAVAAKLAEFQKASRHSTMREQMGQLAASVAKMSNQQVLRLATWAKCVKRCINDSTIFHSGESYHAAWETLRFEFDPVQQNAGSEAQSFAFLLPSWMTAWSHQEPLTTFEGIHAPDHPFVTNWECENAIDVGKMLKGNLHYVPSQKSLGIQLADVSATLVRRAVVRFATIPNLQNYGAMLTKSIGKPLHAAGLFFLAPHDLQDVERRYWGLADAINAVRRTTPTSYCR